MRQLVFFDLIFSVKYIYYHRLWGYDVWHYYWVFNSKI